MHQGPRMSVERRMEDGTLKRGNEAAIPLLPMPPLTSTSHDAMSDDAMSDTSHSSPQPNGSPDTSPLNPWSSTISEDSDSAGVINGTQGNGDISCKLENEKSKAQVESVFGGKDIREDLGEEFETMDQTLRTAVRDRNVSTVRELVAAGASLTRRDRVQMTPLHLCIQQYCYWHYQHNIPRTECLPAEMEIIQAILTAAEHAENNSEILNCLDKDGRSPLYLALESGYFEVVKALLKSGASVEEVSEKKETALHVAVQRPDFLKYFLDHTNIENSFDTDGYAAIHTAAKFDKKESIKLLITKFGMGHLNWVTNDGSTVLHVAAEHGSEEIARYFLQKLNRSHLPVDNKGETPLNRAAKHGHKALTALLLSKGAVLSDKGHRGRTAVEQIARRFADPLKFFEDVFNECITENVPSAMCRERKVHVDYKVLASNNGEGLSQIKVIEELVKWGQSELLIHPLIESLLYLKWRCLLPVVYTIIAIYATFMVSFNTFLVTTFYTTDLNASNFSSPLNETNTRCSKCFDGWSAWVWIILIYISICLLFGQECVYIYLQRRRYFALLESWLKLSMLILASFVPLAVCCGEPATWLRHVACMALLLSWVEAMLLLSRFPDWGYYVLMFERVAYNIFKILLTSICLVIGFSFCFMIQYHSESPFNGPGAAFVKTLVMMSSEFDYEGLFNPDHTALEYTRPTVRFLFVIFVIFIAIVLMNFMIGVAVSDINELNVIGNIRRLEKQVELQSTLDVLVDSAILKPFKRLPRIKYHHNVSKDIESDEKWKVWFGTYDLGVDEYDQNLTMDLQNSIINVARKNAQTKNDDHKKNEKKNKLDVIYNALVKLPYLEEHGSLTEQDLMRKAGSSNLTMKDKILSLEQSNKEIKQSIDELKKSVDKILGIMTSNATPDQTRKKGTR